MSKLGYDLLHLDVEKLFQERKIEEIIEIDKLLAAEIEKKRVELRSMVGDRYRDVLTASDEIINMKTISEEIVDNINKISNRCVHLISETSKADENVRKLYREKNEDRALVIQIRLMMLLNEHIWVKLDEEDYCTAAQLYLLVQHIFTGLTLENVDIFRRLPIVLRIKYITESLKSRILKNVKQKMQEVTLTSNEVANNLSALILLENFTSTDVLHTFIEHRKIALATVIQSTHSSVRMKINCMVQCLVATVRLLHDCFIRCEDDSKGLIWKQLQFIIDENSAPTLSKLPLPTTPLVAYIPEIVSSFKPRCSDFNEIKREDIRKIITEWLRFTLETIKSGLKGALELVTNIKGLHMVREEALKVDVPDDWEEICLEANLPDSFSIWYYFFQTLVSKRAEELITGKVQSNFDRLKGELIEDFQGEGLESFDLMNNFWNEDSSELSRTENRHLGLQMKTKGFSPNVVELCRKLDERFLELLKDFCCYIYGKEYDATSSTLLCFSDARSTKKFIDKDNLEEHLRSECGKQSEILTIFITSHLKTERNPNTLVTKSLLCARLLQGLTTLCPNLNKCCAFNGNSAEWTKVCSNFNKCSLQLWQNWVKNSAGNTEAMAKRLFEKMDTKNMLQILPKWETIDIEEQTEDRVFKSQIKIPSHPSASLQDLLHHLNSSINSVVPHTVPRQIHLEFVEQNVAKLLKKYSELAAEDSSQTRALQFLFDVKFVTTMCVPRDNVGLVAESQRICDGFRSKIDPFDLDVFYGYLQGNVKRSVCQSQVLLGCLLPSSNQLASLGISEKSKEQEKEPSVLVLSTPTVVPWFPLLPVTAPTQKSQSSQQKENKLASTKSPRTPTKKQENQNVVRSGAAALFSGLTTDWFS